jgi:hypothetical protein
VTTATGHEMGNLDEVVAFFQTLIDIGFAWQLQDSYGRTAHSLIEAGLCHIKEEGK